MRLTLLGQTGLLAVAFLTLPGLAVGQAQGTGDLVAVEAGTLFDGTDGQVASEVTILIEDGRIVEVGADVSVPQGAEVIDLSEWTVLPGLMDLHTHLTGDPEDLGADRGAFLFQYPERPALVGARNARTTLLAGFTTVRDVGAPGTTALALRDAVQRGDVPGPRIVAAVSMGTTGSDCDPTTGIRPGTADVEERRPFVFDGPGEAEGTVRRAVRAGADLIKVCATAGVLSLTEEIGPAQMTPKELEAVVTTAESLDRRVAAHAHGLEGIRNAVRAGVPVAFGTDAGVFAHGQNAQEFQLMVDAGMSPADALLAATRDAARALGMEDELGTVEAGRWADLVGVRGNPLEDVTVLEDVGFVMKEGVVYKKDGDPLP